MKIRRSLSTLGLATALGLVTTASAFSADLTITAFGGAWEQAARKCYVTPFQEQTGKTVDVVLGAPVQWVNQIAASPDNPPIDVLLTLIDGAEEGRTRGIVDKMDEAKVPNLADVPAPFKEIVDGHAVVVNYGAAGLAYNTETVKNPPKTWQEFIDGTIAGEWQAALPGINVASTTPTALLWNFNDVLGGKGSDITPAIAKIKELRDSDSVVFWQDVNQFLTLMQSGEADIGIYWDGRAWAAHDAGQETMGFYYPEPGGVISPSVVQKVKNSPDLGWDFVNFILGTGPQECWAQTMQYSVVNTKVSLSEDLKARLADWETVRWPPFAEIVKAMPQWVETWNKEIGR